MVSECINKFGILALDEKGKVLDLQQSRRRVEQDRRYLIAEARKKRVITSLVELSSRDRDFVIKSFIDYLQDRGAFTPLQLGLLFGRLDSHKIDYRASDFKLILRRDRENSCS